MLLVVGAPCNPKMLGVWLHIFRSTCVAGTNICGSKAVVAAVVKMSTVPTLGIVLNNHITKVKS